MSIEDVKLLILSAKSAEREVARFRAEIDKKREELIGIPSALCADKVVTSEKISMPERVYFRLEQLYDLYSAALQRQYEKLTQLESAISELDTIEQEIVRAWIDGKTEEQIGATIGYTGRTVRNYKRRILLKLANKQSLPPIS